MENMLILHLMTYNDVIVLLVYLLIGDLLAVVKSDSVSDIAPLNQIKVLSYKDKGDWILEQKYNIGKKGKTSMLINLFTGIYSYTIVC